MSNTELLSSADAARILGVSVREVQRRAQAGVITPSFKLNGRTGAYLFDRSDVEALAKDGAE